jgi:hypothetical protein
MVRSLMDVSTTQTYGKNATSYLSRFLPQLTSMVTSYLTIPTSTHILAKNCINAAYKCFVDSRDICKYCICMKLRVISKKYCRFKSISLSQFGFLFILEDFLHGKSWNVLLFWLIEVRWRRDILIALSILNDKFRHIHIFMFIFSNLLTGWPRI